MKNQKQQQYKRDSVFIRLSDQMGQRLTEESRRLGVNRQTVARIALGLVLTDGKLEILSDGLKDKHAT